MKLDNKFIQDDLTVTLSIEGLNFKLSLEDAKTLQAELDGLLGKVRPNPIPIVPSIHPPQMPPPPPPPPLPGQNPVWYTAGGNKATPSTLKGKGVTEDLSYVQPRVQNEEL